MEKRQTKYIIDTKTVQEFNDLVDELGIVASKFVEGCMKSFIEGHFKFANGRPLFDGQAASVARETYPASKSTHRSPGRPPKDKEPEPDLSAIENAKLPWPKQDPAKRRTMDYNQVVLMPLERDDSPNLLLETPDEEGRTWREYIEEDWLDFRLQVADEDMWFNESLWILVHCWECKFRKDGKNLYRFRRNETAQEIIDLNNELTEKYYDIIDAKFPEKKESA